VQVYVARTDQLSVATLGELRRLFQAAFDGRFDDDNWHHALGGHHVMARDGATGVIIGHASVVGRDLRVGGGSLRTGYVEAVSTLPARQREGIGRTLMEEVSRILRRRFEMGALATGVHDFYRGLGWEQWWGPTSAYDREGRLYPTPDEDGAIMVLRFGPSEAVDLSWPISAPVRAGDHW
jgi:aminoglycoside 2'-N-acetyltransferase I